MSVVIDTDVVVALLARADAHHEAAVAWLRTADDDLVTTPLAVAEADRLVAGAAPAREAFHHDLDSGAYVVRWWADAIYETVAVAHRAPFLDLTDASLVALAERLGTDRIATFDHENFRRVTRRNGEPFTLLPADSLET